MQNFHLLKSNLDLRAIRSELSRSLLWVDMNSTDNPARTQRNTARIQLRANVEIAGKHYHEIHATRSLSGWQQLTATRQFVVEFAQEVGGEIGRVRVANLSAGAAVIPHIDVGSYCASRDRYHLVINSEQGTRFVAGDESVTMHENELWWFDNRKMHSVYNPGSQSRTHLIFDLLPRRTGGWL